MSLILDALRKSEAERRRGEAPGLHAPPPPVPGASRQAWRQWPIVAGGALVLLAVAILLWPRAPDAPVPSAPADAIDTATAGATRHDAPTPGAAPAVTAPMTDASPADAPPPRTDGAAVVPPPAPSPARPDVGATSRVEQTVVAPAPVAAPAPAPPPEQAAAPAEDALPTLAVLAPGERAALPALKLSMHVWNEEPARRFAIVDGQRLTEGASIGGAVVAQIRRDGVELDVNGRRLLLPRP